MSGLSTPFSPGALDIAGVFIASLYQGHGNQEQSTGLYAKSLLGIKQSLLDTNFIDICLTRGVLYLGLR
jgi:hypothetical protein